MGPGLSVDRERDAEETSLVVVAPTVVTLRRPEVRKLDSDPVGGSQEHQILQGHFQKLGN